MSLCGFGCCHCGRCGDGPAARYGLSSFAGQCPQCGVFNGPRDAVCKACGATLEKTETTALRPTIAMSKPSLMKGDER